jgi:hypothetical protein
MSAERSQEACYLFRRMVALLQIDYFVGAESGLGNSLPCIPANFPRRQSGLRLVATLGLRITSKCTPSLSIDYPFNTCDRDYTNGFGVCWLFTLNRSVLSFAYQPRVAPLVYDNGIKQLEAS